MSHRDRGLEIEKNVKIRGRRERCGQIDHILKSTMWFKKAYYDFFNNVKFQMLNNKVYFTISMKMFHVESTFHKMYQGI